MRKTAYSIANKLYTETKKKGGTPVFSYEELGVPFQYCEVLDLRAAGIVNFGLTEDDRFGVYLSRSVADLDKRAFAEHIQQFKWRK